MLNFFQIITTAARASGDKPILAATYSLPEIVCRDLTTEGIIKGYIAQERPQGENSHPFIAGWWKDGTSSSWFIRGNLSPTMIFLNGIPAMDITKRMLQEAWLKGIHQIHFVKADGSIIRTIGVRSALLRKLFGNWRGNTFQHASYENAFEEMYGLLGHRLRLPAEAFSASRVLIVTGSLQAGGAERQAVNTAAALAKRFPGEIYLSRRDQGPTYDFFKPLVDSAGVTTCMMPEWADEYSSSEILEIQEQLKSCYLELGFMNLFYLIFHHAMLMRRIRPRLVHTFQEFSNVPAGIAADLVGVPRIVLSGRSMAPDNFSIYQPYMAPGYHALLKRRDVIFLNNSEAGAADYARWLGVPRKYFRVIHNGTDFPSTAHQPRASLRSKLGLPQDAVVVGSITGFREEKQPKLWMEMARSIHRTHPNVRFVVFGDGILLDDCRAFVSSNKLLDVIKLPGLTDETWAALSIMDIFVLSSRLEGLPNVLIEAQGMGIPVITPIAGGMMETFIDGETGSGVPLGTSEKMADAVRRLIDEPELADRMGRSAYKHARDMFGIDRMINRTIDAYRIAPECKNDSALPLEDDDSTDIRLCGALEERGYCFSVPLRTVVESAMLRLWEDDRVLGPADSPLDDIRKLGSGRYQVSQDVVLFSTSDGTDPRFNARTYRLRPEQVKPEYEKINILVEKVNADSGHCYVADLRLEPGSALLELWEDDKLLGPGDCLHDFIRRDGGGRYSLWNGCLYFSSSDNTDPRINDRSYFLRRAKPRDVPAGRTCLVPGTSVENLMRYLVSDSIPRSDFVPRRLIHVGGSLGPGGSERQETYTLIGLAKRPFESLQLICFSLTSTPSDRQDFYLPTLRAAGVPVRLVRRQVGEGDPGNMPRRLREIAHALPRGLAPDIADLYWDFMDLKPEIVHAWLDDNNVRAGLAAALAGVPRIFIAGRNVNPTNFSLYRTYMDPAYKALLELPQVTMLNNSCAGRDDYAAWLGIPASRISVIRNGCDFPNHSLREAGAAERDTLRIPANAILIGTVSRFADEKRPK